MKHEKLCYRSILNNLLKRLSRDNPQYSMRAFARDCQIAPSSISRVLNYKQHLSYETASIITHKHFKTIAEKNLFISLFQLETSKNDTIKDLAHKRISRHSKTLSIQTLYPAIFDWYFVAILDLVSLDTPFKGPAQISKALGISHLQAKQAIEQLINLNLLERKNERYQKSYRDLELVSATPSYHLQNIHRQMIGKALDSVNDQSTEERYLRSNTIAINRDDLDELRSLVDSFSRSVQDIATRSNLKNVLYQLNIQLFKLTK